MDEIRSIMGVCPQFDILWDELTAEEHMILYCQIKGVPQQFIDREVKQRLNEV
jgi:ABC-type multidrug transport system ATPase subunit